MKNGSAVCGTVCNGRYGSVQHMGLYSTLYTVVYCINKYANDVYIHIWISILSHGMIYKNIILYSIVCAPTLSYLSNELMKDKYKYKYKYKYSVLQCGKV